MLPTRPCPEILILLLPLILFQAQQQRSLDSTVPQQPSKTGSRRPKKEALASSDPEGKNASPASEQDSGILDVEEDEEEEEASGGRRKGLSGREGWPVLRNLVETAAAGK